MSRDHARVSLAAGNTLYLEDIGSMHGTLLNGVKLMANTPQQLEDGDVVVFGAEVKRGPETFPACSFQINYEAIPYKYDIPSFSSTSYQGSLLNLFSTRSANTFAFPESSDIEDEEEEDYDFSDDDTDKRQQSSEDGASIEQSPKLSQGLAQPIPSIDLTQDDQDDSPVVDLTGETPAEARIMGLMAGRPIDIDERADHVSIGVYAGNAPILVESEDDAEFSSDSDDHSEDEESNSSGSSEGYDLNEGQISDEEDEADDDGIEIYPMEDDQDLDMPALTNLTNVHRFAIATHENPTVLLGEPSGSVMEDEDEPREVDFSEAGSSGLRALFDEDSDMEGDCDAQPMPFGYTVPIGSASQTEKPATFMPSYGNGPNTSGSHILASTFRPDWSEATPVRQPSPSDAAMVKGIVQTSSLFSTTKPLAKPSHLPSTQSLGGTFGKCAFFDARAANKLTFQAMDKQASSIPNLQPPPSTDLPRTESVVENTSNARPISIPAFSASQRMNAANRAAADFSKDFRPARFERSIDRSRISMFAAGLSNNTPLLEAVVSTREECAFLDKPDQTPMPVRAPSPLPDMTSAVSYNNSKENMAIHRSGIKINDIIDKSSRKRGVEDISNTTEKELETWGSRDPSTVANESPALVDTSSATANPAAPEQRPTKRLKRVLERVGYAALGGVAVGAGLFSVLVATAPDFM